MVMVFVYIYSRTYEDQVMAVGVAIVRVATVSVATVSVVLTAYYVLLTTHCLLLTTHYSLNPSLPGDEPAGVLPDTLRLAAIHTDATGRPADGRHRA
eukprot:scaffold56116_cov72-Phaeocystis_antarctica.AAC.5